MRYSPRQIRAVYIRPFYSFNKIVIFAQEPILWVRYALIYNMYIYRIDIYIHTSFVGFIRELRPLGKRSMFCLDDDLFPVFFFGSQMIALLHCAHVACRECLKTYFTIQIREHNIGELRCPFCREPDLSDESIEQTYFSNMSVLVSCLVWCWSEDTQPYLYTHIYI